MKISEERIKELNSLQDIISYKFIDLNLLNKALTHKSYANEKNAKLKHNERMEFLGDSVLDILVSKHLFEKFNEFSEGKLSKIRAAVVNESSLAKLAEKMSLGDYLLLGKGENNSGGRKKTSILADAFEALAGAVFLDGGLEASSNICLPLLKGEIETICESWSFRDFKSDLQEYTQDKMVCIPNYKVIREIGPDHAKEFEVIVTVKNEICGKGLGRTKKEAEQAAAKVAMQKFSSRYNSSNKIHSNS
ncbi:MAG: ribonuclease III [Nitrospina sp.]|nr:ribonuclease III [Nitrospina sp.]|tara:strand:- start:269 stop:1012 length:744 start_codon:yes stop_codon:yes gene_type:complete